MTFNGQSLVPTRVASGNSYKKLNNKADNALV